MADGEDVGGRFPPGSGIWSLRSGGRAEQDSSRSLSASRDQWQETASTWEGRRGGSSLANADVVVLA